MWPCCLQFNNVYLYSSSSWQKASHDPYYHINQLIYVNYWKLCLSDSWCANQCPASMMLKKCVLLSAGTDWIVRIPLDSSVFCFLLLIWSEFIFSNVFPLFFGLYLEDCNKTVPSVDTCVPFMELDNGSRILFEDLLDPWWLLQPILWGEPLPWGKTASAGGFITSIHGKSTNCCNREISVRTSDH